MKSLLNKIALLMGICCALGTGQAVAQDCDIPVAVVVMQQSDEVPEASAQLLTNTLTRVAVSNGMNAELPYSQFVLSARCDMLDKSILPGPPAKVSCNLGITLYVADVYNKKKFSSAYIELNGVGNNEVKAYNNAFSQLRPKAPMVEQMLETGKSMIMNYYNTQYPNILKEARRLAGLQRFDEALALITAIPACSRGGDEAISEGLKIYTRYRDRYNLQLLNKARGIWAAGQDQASAREVADILLQIDPEAACYNDALALSKEIKTQVRSDLDLEMREKYHDAVKLEQQRIAAIRAIGVAYGNGQKAKTTNIAWLR